VTEEGPGPARNPADIAGQLHAMADKLMSGWASAAGAAAKRPAVPAVPAMPSMPSMPAMPAMPATLSAQQMQAVLDDLAARRAQVQALRSSLDTFDEQLGALEASLRPIAEWTKSWADLEKSVGDFWRLPGSGSQAP